MIINVDIIWGKKKRKILGDGDLFLTEMLITL
jgi:hypothetical protein